MKEPRLIHVGRPLKRVEVTFGYVDAAGDEAIDAAKQNALERAGFKVGTVEDFLGSEGHIGGSAMNPLTMDLTESALTGALKVGQFVLETSQVDPFLSADAKARWKHEMEASNGRIQEMITARQEGGKTTMKDRTVYMMHTSLVENFARITKRRQNAT